MFSVFADERVNIMWKPCNIVIKTFTKLWNNEFKIYDIKTSRFSHKHYFLHTTTS